MAPGRPPGPKTLIPTDWVISESFVACMRRLELRNKRNKWLRPMDNVRESPNAYETVGELDNESSQRMGHKDLPPTEEMLARGEPDESVPNVGFAPERICGRAKLSQKPVLAFRSNGGAFPNSISKRVFSGRQNWRIWKERDGDVRYGRTLNDSRTYHTS